ncbi:TetR/AcrR family transcriptional regulator [Jatrophihabitans sp. DSM 45814]
MILSTANSQQLTAHCRTGASLRGEILGAAGRLFTDYGYAATSTRAIARMVGVRQASLYYHFSCKEDILAGLLTDAFKHALAFAEVLQRSVQPPHIQLYAQSYFDAATSRRDAFNTSGLYQLPELRSERFAEFRAARDKLRAAYGEYIAAGVASGVFAPTCSAQMLTELVFAFVGGTSVVQDGQTAGRSSARSRSVTSARVVAVGALRVLACRPELVTEAVCEAAALLAASGCDHLENV